jgi:thiol-disulfide isomerase/thioredoxin
MTDTTAGGNPPRTAPEAPPPAEAADKPARGGRSGGQARLAMAAVAVAAAVALFWPRGDGSFDAPGGFVLDGQGRPQTLAGRLAPVSLVHFWATWCPPCITEIPALDRLSDDFGDHPDFDLVMIAVDDGVETVETFVGDRAAMMLYDPTWDVARRYGTRKLPETYLVIDGKVVDKWEGAVDWDRREIRARLEAALAGEGREKREGREVAAGGSGAGSAAVGAGAGG